MREVEIKAWAKDPEGIKNYFDKVAGPSGPVDKSDCYFNIPLLDRPALRMRKNNGVLEFTSKKKIKNDNGEETNFEYEFIADMSQYDKAKDFFIALGYEHYFDKIKKGYEWNYKGVHVELLDVKHVGVFLEMEKLLPFDAKKEDIDCAINTIYEILNECGLGLEDIERRSYSSMILKRG